MDPIVMLATAAIAIVVVILTEKNFSRKLRSSGFVSQDMYKEGDVFLPNKGGLLILFGMVIALMTAILFFRVSNFFLPDNPFPGGLSRMDEAMLYTVLLYAFYGVLDDYMDVGRISKILMPLLFSYPLVTTLVLPTFAHATLGDPYIAFPLIGSLNLGQDLITFGGYGINISQVIRFLMVPLYIMVVANLANMHSGFNGLQSGLSLIVLGSLLFKSVLDSRMDDVLAASALCGGLAGFWWYNKYPARFFEGNIGSMTVGATIGSVIIIQGYYVVGFVMLIPHTVNFLMYAYWRLKRKMLHSKGKDVGVYHHQIKFGKVLEDGTLKVPNRLTLKWFIPFHKPTTEKHATWYMYALTAVFCVIGILLPAY